MNDRIKELMESLHLNQQAFADRIGISSATLSSIFTGRTKVTLNTVKAIKDKFPTLNYGWLLDGIGPMFNNANSDGTSSSSTPSSNSDGEAFLDFDDTSSSSVSPDAALDHSSYGAQSSSSVRENFDSRHQQTYDASGRRQNPQASTPKIINNIRRSVAEILVIYDDQTCETFVPKK